jgi:AcrR family transcriptional regulator
MTEAGRKGRHRILSDEVILQAAFEAFAAEGYEAMSVRKLNIDLGLSHETVRQRFGSKSELYFAAVDHGIATFYNLYFEELGLLGDADGDLQELRFAMRAFMTASIRFPLLANLVNHEATSPNERMDYIFASGYLPGMKFYTTTLERLVGDEVIPPITARDVFFLVDAGLSPFAQVGLSRAFDAVAGPLDECAHVDQFLDFVFRGLVRTGD